MGTRVRTCARPLHRVKVALCGWSAVGRAQRECSAASDQCTHVRRVMRVVVGSYVCARILTLAGCGVGRGRGVASRVLRWPDGGGPPPPDARDNQPPST